MQSLTALQIVVLILVLGWSLFWKGIALWQAARNNQRYWFVALLVVNSVGILEALYLALWREKRQDNC